MSFLYLSYLPALASKVWSKPTFTHALHDLVTFVQFKNVKSTPGEVLFLVKLQARLFYTFQINGDYS